jgi:hypothetical protein
MKIKAICGMEPPRADEYPIMHEVGQKSYGFTVARIEAREQNLGDHALLWFDVYDLDGLRRCSLQGRAIAEVRYEPEVGQ